MAQPKECGGLGVRPLATQNHSLLLKVHKLHEPGTAPWKTWFLSQHSGNLGSIEQDSYVTRIITKELPRYRDLTIISLVNGAAASFLA